MKYDDASWHSGGEQFPPELPREAAATHTGMFVAWALLSDLSGELHIEVFPEDIHQLETRSITPGVFFIASCDGKFTDEDLNVEGNEFAAHYFALDKGQYMYDYETVLRHDIPEEPQGLGLYYVADTWENFDKICPTLNRRLAEWRDNKS